MPSYISMESSGNLLLEDGVSRAQLEQSVFTSPILDDFNRADENPLPAVAGWNVAAWSTGGQSSGPLRVTSNTCRPANVPGSSNFIAMQARSSALNPDQEVYFTLPSNFPGGSSYTLMARAGQPSGGAVSYIATLNTNLGGSPFSLEIYRTVQTSFGFAGGRVIASTTSFSVVPELNGRLGFRVYGSNPVTLEIWATIGGIWKRALIGTDTASDQITSAGAIGLGIGQNTNQSGSVVSVDNFGGGDGITPTTMNDVYPTYTIGKSDSLSFKPIQSLPVYPQLLGLSDAPYLINRRVQSAGVPTGKADHALQLSTRAWPTPKTMTKPRPVAGQIWPRRK